MNFWKTISCRWSREELLTWHSLKKTGYILLPFLIYMLVKDMAEICLWALTELLITKGGDAVTAFVSRNASTAGGLVSGLAIFLGMAAIYRPVKNELGQKENGQAETQIKQAINANYLTAYGFLAALSFCVAVSLNIIFYQTGYSQNSADYQQVQQAQYGVQFTVGLVLYGLISPLAEEAVFRGVIYNRMKRCFQKRTALLFSALLFGLYHGNMVQALYGTLMGIIIAVVYDRYESFAAPVLFHAVANISVYVMTSRMGFSEMNGNSLTAWLIAAVTAGFAVIFFILADNFIKKSRIVK
jgi:membrane protease YdiL (CAAX protease family)